MTHLEMLREMMRNQDALNCVVNKDWRSANNNWDRAIWTECAELMGHLNWEWWKSTDAKPDMQQVRLEIADIWHFLLSKMLLQPEEEILRNFKWPGPSGTELPDSIGFSVECLVNSCLTARAYSWMLQFMNFHDVCIHANVSFDDLYILHTSKYVLNVFRQEHGYKEGTYQKRWYDGREDNEHLHELIGYMSTPPYTFNPTALPEMLATRYARNALPHASEYVSM